MGALGDEEEDTNPNDVKGERAATNTRSSQEHGR